MVNELFQKHHGLPGVPQTIGNPGGDGTQGSNIYFGNVSEFFDSVEVSVDTFVRIASKKNISTKKYYTGVFKQQESSGPDSEETYTYERHNYILAARNTTGQHVECVLEYIQHC